MIRLQRFILRLYPSEWRQRYGAEMESLLEDTHGDSLTALN